MISQIAGWLALAVVAVVILYLMRGGSGRVRDAQGANCPVCGSGAVEAKETGHGIEVLAQDYHCPDCGLERAALEGRDAEIVDVLESMNAHDPKLARATSGSPVTGPSPNNPAAVDREEERLLEVVEALERLAEDHEELFELETDDGVTLAERVASVSEMRGRIVADESGLHASDDARERRAFRELQRKRRQISDVWDSVRQRLAEEVRGGGGMVAADP